MTLCIVCPTGCQLETEWSGGDITVTGNRCKRGIEFAVSELNNPMRSLTTTVRTVFPEVPVLPVRTEGEIPKGRLREAMEILNRVVVTRTVRRGETILEDLMGCRVIAASSVLMDVLQEGGTHHV